jgi:hypothetical protein
MENIIYPVDVWEIIITDVNMDIVTIDTKGASTTYLKIELTTTVCH